MNKPVLLIFGLVFTASCQKPAQPPAAPVPVPTVDVQLPITQDITDTEEFPGRLESTDTITVRARVTGYLDQVLFTDGADVKKGDPLFVIDPKPYQAEVDRARAAVVQAKAKHDRIQKDYLRIKEGTDKGAFSMEELERITGERDEAAAGVKVAEAQEVLAKTNLDYTRITALTTGRIGRRMVDPGNVVKADDTILTTIVSMDPLYASFDIDERTLLRLIAQGNLTGLAGDKVVVGVALADETGFPRNAVIDFADHQVNPRTGTVRVRAVLQNPDKKLAPGLFARLKLPVGKPRKALLIPDEAVNSDQGLKFVFVVTDTGEIARKTVVLGTVVDRNRVVEKGLSPTDKVVVTGLQRLRPGMKVVAKVVENKLTSSEPHAGGHSAAGGR
jgi:RND family efflux transporter MFP subunit